MKTYFLGLDGGGSKTSVIVVDDAMNPLGHGIAGPSNFLSVGIEEASHELASAIDQAVSTAKITRDDVEYAWCGIAGFDHPLHGRKLVDAIRVFFPRGNFSVSTDARIALTAGVGSGQGIVVIAGTGSIAFGRNAAGEEARAGGWGPTIGDEGSGYSIGRLGLAAVLRAYDGRGPATSMTEHLFTELDIGDPKDLPVIVYAPSAHADTIATFNRIVIHAANEGDEVAARILESEGRELGSMVLAVARRLGIQDTDFPVAYVGGAFREGRQLLDALRRTLTEGAPGARLQTPLESPAEGAARLAILAADAARQSS